MAAVAISATKAWARLEKEVAYLGTVLPGGMAEAKGHLEDMKKLASEIAPPGGTEGFIRSIYIAYSSGLNDMAAAKAVAVEASKLAVITFTDEVDAVKLLTGITNSFEKQLSAYVGPAAKAQRVSELLFQTTKLGAVELPELVNTLSRVTSTAAALDVPLEQVLAALAGLTNRGVSAAESATALNNMFNRMLKPTKESIKVANDLGIAWDRTFIQKQGGIAGAYAEVKKRMDAMNMSAVEQDHALASLTGTQRGMKGALFLMADGGKDWLEISDKIAASAGATNDAFALVEETMARQLTHMKEDWNQFRQEMGEGIDAPVAKWLISLRTLGAAFHDTFVKGVVGAITKALDVMSKFNNFIATGFKAGGLSGIKDAMIGAVNAFFVKLSDPEMGRKLGARLGASIRKGLGAVGIADAINWKAIKAAFKSVSDGFRDDMKENFSDKNMALMMAGFVYFFAPGGPLLRMAFAAIATLPWSDSLHKQLPKMAEGLGKLTNSVATTLQKVLNSVDWYKLGETIGTAINTFFKTVNWPNVFRALTNVIASTFGLLNGILQTVDWKSIGTILWNGIKPIAIWLLDEFRTQLPKIAISLGKLVNVMATTIYKALNSVDWFELGQIIGTAIISFFKTVNWHQVLLTLKNVVVSIIGLFAGIADSLKKVDWKEVGTKLTFSLKVAAADFYNWLITYDWKTLAVSMWNAIKAIVGWLYESFLVIPWKKIGLALWYGIEFVATSFYNAVVALDWGKLRDNLWTAIKTIVTWFSDEFKKIDWISYREKVHEAFSKVGVFLTEKFNEAIAYLKTIDWYQVLLTLTNNMRSAFDAGLEVLRTADWAGLFAIAGTILSGIFTVARDIFTNTDWTAVFATLKVILDGIINAALDFIRNEPWGTDVKLLTDAVMLAFTSAVDYLKNTKWVTGDDGSGGIIGTLLTALKKIVDQFIISMTKTPEEWYVIFDGIFTTLKNIWNDTMNWISSPDRNWGATFNNLRIALTNIANGFAAAIASALTPDFIEKPFVAIRDSVPAQTFVEDLNRGGARLGLNGVGAAGAAWQEPGPIRRGFDVPIIAKTSPLPVDTWQGPLRFGGGRANGGLFTSPGMHLIGEAGPELLLPLTRPGRMAELLAQAFTTGHLKLPRVSYPTTLAASSTSPELTRVLGALENAISKGISVNVTVNSNAGLERSLYRLGVRS